MSKPTHYAYTIRDYEKDGSKEGFWVRIGVAFAHKDNEGFDVLLDALPINGKVTIRKPKPNEKPEG